MVEVSYFISQSDLSGLRHRLLFLLLLPLELKIRPAYRALTSGTRPVTSIWRQNSRGNDGSQHTTLSIQTPSLAGPGNKRRRSCSTFHSSSSFPRLEMCHTCNITSRRLSYPLPETKGVINSLRELGPRNIPKLRCFNCWLLPTSTFRALHVTQLLSKRYCSRVKIILLTA